jgi:hypothetical protein
VMISYPQLLTLLTVTPLTSTKAESSIPEVAV